MTGRVDVRWRPQRVAPPRQDNAAAFRAVPACGKIWRSAQKMPGASQETPGYGTELRVGFLSEAWGGVLPGGHTADCIYAVLRPGFPASSPLSGRKQGPRFHSYIELLMPRMLSTWAMTLGVTGLFATGSSMAFARAMASARAARSATVVCGIAMAASLASS